MRDNEKCNISHAPSTGLCSIQFSILNVVNDPEGPEKHKNQVKIYKIDLNLNVYDINNDLTIPSQFVCVITNDPSCCANCLQVTRSPFISGTHVSAPSLLGGRALDHMCN